jgi:short-subunit dehydrogenase
MPTALITGASAGIGATFARKLAARGYDLILVARRRDRLEQLARELRRADVLEANLTDDRDLDRVAEACARVDLLVNNAGFGVRGRFWEADLEGQLEMHRLHVLTTVRLTHAALAAMVPRKRGAVINVSSVAGFITGPESVSYCATKRWMNGFSEGLAMEVAGTGVTVQALCPGYTLTEFHDVAHIDRGKIAKWMWMNSDDVVEDSLRALETGKVFVIPGWQYKMAVILSRFLPSWLLQRVAQRR